MHRLALIAIFNFRSCKHVSLPLGDFTPVVGYNNAGKSNILTAIEWLIDPFPLGSTDFNDPKQKIMVEGTVAGITEKLIAKMPANQQGQIKPYVKNDELRFRRTIPQPGATSTIKIEVHDPGIADENNQGAWVANPTGISQALKALFPESIRVHAMQDAADDVSKQSKGNTIGKLIADLIEPIRKAHDGELRKALDVISEKLSASGSGRAATLMEFDAGATECLNDLFPGLALRIDLPLPEIPDLFKNGTVRVIEQQGGASAIRSFSTIGHGAQRCIQLALIRYLAEKDVPSDDGKRKLLLIDEPELYLHPQGIEQVRESLTKLSVGRYQVVFSTHSPMMLHRDHAPNAVIIRKPDAIQGTVARRPLASAVRTAIADAGHSSRVLFELGNAAQVFFSDRVLLNEGKTEQRILPLLYEIYLGRTPRADRLGVVPMNGSGSFHSALTVLNAMDINTKILADLDYAFLHAAKATGSQVVPDMAAARPILKRLQTIYSFSLEGDLPKGDKKGGFTAAQVWALFAKDSEGQKVAAAEHDKLKAHGIWIWKEGTIEDVLGVSDKGEDAIDCLWHECSKLRSGDIQTKYPSMAEFLDWITT